jgi:tetratricopeptide (TPR) repeat protein
MPGAVISETNIPIRPKERRHDHVARNSDHLGVRASGPRPPGPPGPPPPHMQPQARAQAFKRKLDLEAKLAVAQKRQVSRKETDQHIRAARTFAWGALVPLAIIVLGTALLLIGALIFWPAAHHESVVAVLDDQGERARTAARTDTYGGYQDASKHLQSAIAATGPGGPQLAEITEGYLSALGVEDIGRLKLAALADLAETHAILEVRFGHATDPSSLALLAQLQGTGTRSPQVAAAEAWRLLGRGKLDGALASLDTDIATYPSSANLHYLRGVALDRMGDHDLARQAWERSQVLDARHVPTRVALGTWHARRRSQLASDLFADVLERLSPEHPGATIERATYWIDTGQNTRQAREALDKVLDANNMPLSSVERAQAHYARGLWFGANAEPTKAADEFAAALRLDPANPMAAAARIKLLIDEDDLETAQKALTESTGRGGNQERLRTLRSLWFLRSGEPSKAHEALGLVSGTNPVAQRLLGDIMVELGDWRAAESAYNRALALGDKDAAADLQLARAVQGNADALLRLQADTVRSSDAATSWRYGRARLERKDLESAVVHLQKAHRIDPHGTFRHRIPAVADLCRLFEASGKVVEARKACDEAIARRPSHEPSHRIRARIAALEGDDATAYGLLSALSARHPTDRAIMLELVRAQIHQGRLSEATAAIEQLIAHKEASADLHVLQGLLEFFRYRHGFALGYFQRALAARSDDSEAHLYAARCLLQTGRPSAAAEHIRAARKDPRWAVPALAASSEYHRQQGDWRAAVKDASRALRLARRQVTPPRHVAQAHAALAQGLEMRNGATDPSVSNALQRAASLDHAPAFYHLARIALARSDKGTYVRALQDAVDRDPFLCPAVALLRREVRANPALDVRVPDTCR